MPVTDLTGTTWVFNDTIAFSGSTAWDVNFISNDVVYNRIEITASKGVKIIYVGSSSPLYVYEDVWQYEVNKTITITSKLSEVTNGDTLLTLLQSNATKQ